MSIYGPFSKIATNAPLRMNRKTLSLLNRERVRSYLERNLGCSRKEVYNALNLCPKTVSAAIKAIRAENLDVKRKPMPLVVD